MYRITRFAVLSIVVSCCAAAYAASETDWRAMARYEHGQDFKPLLEIDREVIAVMSEPSRRDAFAARLAGLLTDKQTTLAAKQFICQKLQTVGTPAQVPVLARMLDDPKTAEMARTTLEQIPGDESLNVLRAGLKKYRGELLVGLINSVAARRDRAAVASLTTLADDQDAAVAGAAVWALGRIGGREAVAIVAAKAAQSPKPLPPGLAVPYLRCAAWLLDDGQTAEAVAIYRRLASADESLPTRQNALQGILRAAGERRIEIILDWLADDDPLKRETAASELNHVEFDASLVQPDRLRDMPVAGRILLLEAMAARRLAAARPAAMEAARSDDPALRRATVRSLETLGDASCVALLIDEMAGKSPLAQDARRSLVALPGDDVDRAILAAMKGADDARRAGLIDVLQRRKSTLAVGILLDEAANPSPAVHGPALLALRGLASTQDISALVALLPTVENARQRDEIEKTVLLLCKAAKKDKKADPAAPVLAVHAKADRATRVALLPLLGRLGGKKSLALVSDAVASDDREIKTAGIRALCNWPDASVAGRLLSLAKNHLEEPQRTWALRAYVRVITLKSDRPEAETLAMLKRAMSLARGDAERHLIVERAATVRTMETLRWIAPYLDNPALAQSACKTVVELAHHRFLRNPNKDEFDALLKKVQKIGKDPEIVERANRYLLGI